MVKSIIGYDVTLREQRRVRDCGAIHLGRSPQLQIAQQSASLGAQPRISPSYSTFDDFGAEAGLLCNIMGAKLPKYREAVQWELRSNSPGFYERYVTLRAQRGVRDCAAICERSEPRGEAPSL